MPKATVDKHGDTLSHKNKVRPPRHCEVSPPPGDSIRSQKGDHHQLSTTVSARSHPRHNFRALRLTVDIAHMMAFGELQK
jgi:hypothetical protein